MEWKDIITPELVATILINLATITSALIAGFKLFFKKWKEDKQNEASNVAKGLTIQAETDKRIIKKLDELKEVLGADRVQIYDFHNGVHYANGRSAVRITCTYESCKYGVPPYQNNLVGLPISCLPNFISKLLDDGEFICKDLESIKTGYPATYVFKKNMGIKAFHDIVFRNECGEIVGFIAIQFTESDYRMDELILHKFVGSIEADLIAMMTDINK